MQLYNKMGNNMSTNCLINTVILCINFFNQFEPTCTLYKFTLYTSCSLLLVM